MFAPSFLAKIPIERVRGLLANVKQQLGAFKTVTGSGTDYIVHLAQGELTAHLVLNAAGQITGLLLRPKDSASLTRRHRAV